jgi:murein L,D-transpeptidase YafK
MKVILPISFLLATLLIATISCESRSTGSNRYANPLVPDVASLERGEENEYREINSATLKLPLVEPQIVVHKGKRRLYLCAKQQVVRAYRIALGSTPKGDKEKEGDRRTPEGKFYICQKNRNSKYYLSLGLSYPSQEDAARGLRSHLITREEYDRIVDAIREHSCPDWNTPLGGEVFIHGNGSKRDWTWGCVALEDADIRELFDAVPEGTPVTIRP